jgi:hypothetical protein
LDLLEDRSLPSLFTVTNLGDEGVGIGVEGDLRYAVNTANADRDPSNQIVFDPGLAGTIALTQGQLNVSKGLEIDGPGQDVLTISGSNRSGVFNIDPRAQNVSFLDLTIADGTSSQGGGITNNTATLALTRVRLTGNTASGNGGAIFHAGVRGGVILTDSLVDGNVAQEAGGIYSSNTLTLVRSTVSNNSVRPAGSKNTLAGPDIPPPGSTSGISAVSAHEMTMTDSTITGNVERSFFGATVQVGAATVIDSQITDNIGTGIVLGGGSHVFTGTTISGNVARFGGGGVSSNDGDTQITNCTISDNSADDGGAGIRYFFGSVEVTSSTITGNAAGAMSSAEGGGGILVSAGGDHRVLLRNTIVAGNSSASTGPDVQGDVFSFGYNLIGQPDNSTGWLATDRTGTSANPIDPRLGPLQDNGGPTPTHAVLAGSPAIGTGDPALRSTLDQRGAQRNAGSPTIGAVGVILATHLRVVAPAQVAAGEPFTLTVAAVDDLGNVASTYTGRVHFSSTDSDAQLPDDTTFGAGDGGMQTFTATLLTPGQQTIVVNDTAQASFRGTATVSVNEAEGFSPVPADLVRSEPDDTGLTVLGPVNPRTSWRHFRLE